MYIPSSTVLTVLSLLLPSTAAPVHASTVSPASGNTLTSHDYVPFRDNDHSSRTDGRSTYMPHAYKESHEETDRYMSTQGHSVSYLHTRQTHSPDYRNANTTVPGISSASSSSSSSSSSASYRRSQEIDPHYEAEKDDRLFEDDESPRMPRGWRTMPAKRGIIRPRQDTRLQAAATAPNNTTSHVPHKAPHLFNATHIKHAETAVKPSTSTPRIPESLVESLLRSLSESELDSPLTSNSSTDNKTTHASSSNTSAVTTNPIQVSSNDSRPPNAIVVEVSPIRRRPAKDGASTSSPRSVATSRIESRNGESTRTKRFGDGMQ